VDRPLLRELGHGGREVALGLSERGIGRGETVAIVSETRPEWSQACIGHLLHRDDAGRRLPGELPGGVRYILEHSDSKAVFVMDREQLAKVHRIRADLPLREQVIVLEPDGGEQEEPPP
jgi:long-chain acyl-CoA synthetase